MPLSWVEHCRRRDRPAADAGKTSRRAVRSPAARPRASWAAAGMLSPAPDSPSAIPLVPFGRASSPSLSAICCRSRRALRASRGLRCEGAIELLFSGDAERQLSTLIALHHGLGLPTEPLPIDDARKLEPSLGREACAAAWMDYESSVDPRALGEAVLAAATASGVELHSHF